MQPNWASVAGKADDSRHRARGSRATAADELKRRDLRKEREEMLTRHVTGRQRLIARQDCASA